MGVVRSIVSWNGHDVLCEDDGEGFTLRDPETLFVLAEGIWVGRDGVWASTALDLNAQSADESARSKTPSPRLSNRSLARALNEGESEASVSDQKESEDRESERPQPDRYSGGTCPDGCCH